MSTAVIEIVTARIINSLKAGVKPWVKEWSATGPAYIFPRNLKTNNQYSGINFVSLYCEALDKDYQSPFWLTANQAKEMGGHIRKGEHGTPILWAKSASLEMLCNGCEKQFPTPKKGAAQCPRCKGKDLALTEGRSSWRFYLAFNLDQVEGVECPQAGNLPTLTGTPADFIKNTGAKIRHGGGKAYYSPGLDFIQLPKPQDFTSLPAYYATALHELGHWTGHEDRLNRDFTGRFGQDAYAFEELIAELTSAFSCASLGVPSNLENHASYLDHWLKILAEKPGALIEACSKASKAFEYLQELASTAAAKAPEGQLTLFSRNTEEVAA